MPLGKLSWPRFMPPAPAAGVKRFTGVAVRSGTMPAARGVSVALATLFPGTTL